MEAIVVNGERIEPETIYREMQYFPADQAEDALHQATRSLIIQKLLAGEVKKQDLEDDNHSAEQQVENLLEQKVYKQLAEPSEDECLRFYKSQTDRFSSSSLVEARHILLAVAPEDAKGRVAKVAEAKALISRLEEQPEQFVYLATKFSDCPSKSTGGALGQIQKGQTVPEFEHILLQSPEGLITAPIESRYGVHVVEVIKLIPGRTLPFEQVHDKINTYLTEQQERHAISDYLHRLVDAAEIEAFDMELVPLVQ